ncbi:MAG: acyltransferase, partial [Gammaproteobacteria bacterium]
MQQSAYLPFVDGLRAIAVLFVVIYHTDLGLLPGGFVGVDVFFVISGYLITNHLAKQIHDNSFTF